MLYHFTKRTLCHARSMSIMLVFGLCFPAIGIAQSFQDDTGAGQRLNLAGKTAGLSQRIAWEACNVTASVDPDAANAGIAASHQELGVVLTALENGDADLGIIGAETRPQTEQALAAMQQELNVLLPMTKNLSSLSITAEQLRLIQDQSTLLQSAAERLRVEIGAQYTNPAVLLIVDALQIEVASRQRLLMMQIGNAACTEIVSPSNETDEQKILAMTAQFDTILNGLASGIESIGLKPPPNVATKDAIQQLQGNWDDIQLFIAQFIAASAAADDRATAYRSVVEGMRPMIVALDDLVALYVENSRQRL